MYVHVHNKRNYIYIHVRVRTCIHVTLLLYNIIIRCNCKRKNHFIPTFQHSHEQGVEMLTISPRVTTNILVMSVPSQSGLYKALCMHVLLQTKWISVLHHVTDEHEWATGKCDLTEPPKNQDGQTIQKGRPCISVSTKDCFRPAVATNLEVLYPVQVLCTLYMYSVCVHVHIYTANYCMYTYLTGILDSWNATTTSYLHTLPSALLTGMLGLHVYDY